MIIMKEYFETNRKAWDLRVDVHKTSEMYDLETFKNGRNSLTEIELKALGGIVEGKSLLHLQCHFGQDTMSWQRRGAQCTGLDFSDVAVQSARELAAGLEEDAADVESGIQRHF